MFWELPLSHVAISPACSYCQAMNRLSQTIHWLGIILFWVCVGCGAYVTAIFWPTVKNNFNVALMIMGAGIIFGTFAYVFCRALAYTFSDGE